MLASVGAVAMTSGLVLLAGAGASQADGNGADSSDDAHKVLVCKYVGTPGEDERLKEGKNPISVDSSAAVGTWFKDAQGRSFVLAVDDGSSTHSDAECPKVDDEEKLDVCPNIDGVQASVPDGMVKNDAGDCVKKDVVVDVCPNIDGVQASVPDGMVKNAAGDCVDKPDDGLCPPGGSAPEDTDGELNEEDGETDRDNKCVEAVKPVVNQSAECDEEGFLRVRATRGVTYFLDGVEIEAGIHPGPLSGTITAKARPAFELSNPNFSFEVNIPAAKDCATATPSVTPSQTATVTPSQTATATPSETATVTPSETATVTPSETATVTPSETATVIPSETATTPGEIAGTEGVPPIDETPEVVPTAVDAGLPGGPAGTSSTDLLAKMLVGGGLALMMAAGWLQMGRHNRGAHQA